MEQNNDKPLPILYSFRRCPYAIRARMAIAFSGQKVEHREVDLKQKPVQLIQISPKATVPVLQLNQGEILEESLDIMLWALSLNDPDGWLENNGQAASELIEMNDNKFKYYLDRYKYADRFPEHSVEYHRKKASEFPAKLNSLLQSSSYLVSKKVSLVDVAIFPFIRQFAFVDKNGFDSMNWPYLQKWLEFFLETELFKTVMKKHKPWQSGDESVTFP